MGHVRYQIIGFLVFWFHSETFFNSRWYWRSWPPDMNDLWRSKYEINENKSCEVSNDSFFGVPIPFWDPFLTSDDPGGGDLQILMTSGGQNMKSMKIVMRGITSKVFWCSASGLRPLFTLRWSRRSWPPDINDIWRSNDENNENGAFYQIMVFLNTILNIFLNLRFRIIWGHFIYFILSILSQII